MTPPPIPEPIQPLSYHTPTVQALELRTVATRQRGLILCILAYICCAIASFTVPDNVRIIPQLLLLATSVVALVFVFLLATRVYGTVVGVVLGIFTIVPLLGLLILLAVNSKATKILRAGGLHVGFLGATVPPGV